MTGATPPRAPHDNSAAELDALFELGKRLGGFDPTISAEWIDGALTALMAGPRVPAAPAECVDALFGDTWSRTFSDPDDVAQALAVLDARWRVLRLQLDPDAIEADPLALRLDPLLLDVGDAERPLAPAKPAPADDRVPVILPPQAGADEDADDERDAEGEEDAGGGDVEGAGHDGDENDGDEDVGDEGDDDDFVLHHGEDWARGVLAVVSMPEWGWTEPSDGDPKELDTALRPVQALTLPAMLLPVWASMRFPGEDPATLTREDLVDDACFAMQALRLWWMEHAPRTAPRRAEAKPGRNDPCPCGSGKKYKKCHGAQA